MTQTITHDAVRVQSKVASPHAAQRFLGASMILVLAGGFALACIAMSGSSAQRRISDTLSISAFLSGQTAAAVNYVEARELPGDPLWRAMGGVLRWRLFDSGGPQVWVARNERLYFMDELRPWPNAEANMQFRADVLGHVSGALSARHIDLLVALVPDKARSLQDGPRSAQAKARHDAFAALLRERGIAMADLDQVFANTGQAGELFYRTDTHWNQLGAALAAQGISASVRTPLDHSHHYETVADPALSDVEGDLLRLMSLDVVPDGLIIPLRPPIDQEHVEQTIEIDPPALSDGLLDLAPSADVVLLGTSFSNRSNFFGRLKQALQTSALNFVETNGGFAKAARSYFSSPTFRDEPPKLIVWEMPERFVGQPLTDDDRALTLMFQNPLDAIHPQTAKLSLGLRQDLEVQ